MKKSLLFHLFVLFIFGFSLSAQAETEFIYGKIKTFLGETYEGQIRWGSEEAFWTDRFNANKVYNHNIDFLSDKEIVQLKKEKQGLKPEDWKKIDATQMLNDKSEYAFLHQFSCQFGEIRSLKMTRWKKAELQLRDGSKVIVSGKGTNDMDTPITIYDRKRGKIEVDWMEIDQVEFLREPSKFKSAIGEPLYGTVYTSQGSYSGVIEWDKDERVTSDELDGHQKTGTFKATFAKIRAIKPHQSGSLVTMEDGEEVYVFGTNDVNNKNRGVIITNDEIGHINVDWENLERVEFIPKKKKGKGKGYSQFKNPKKITGIVKTKQGKSLRGAIVFDLDEQFDFEVLNGGSGKMLYEIPFRNIKRISPNNASNCTVELRSKKKIKLTDSQDVSFKNEGLLVFQDSANPTYVSWREVEEVVFN